MRWSDSSSCPTSLSQMYRYGSRTGVESVCADKQPARDRLSRPSNPVIASQWTMQTRTRLLPQRQTYVCCWTVPNEYLHPQALAVTHPMTRVMKGDGNCGWRGRALCTWKRSVYLSLIVSSGGIRLFRNTLCASGHSARAAGTGPDQISQHPSGPGGPAGTSV